LFVLDIKKSIEFYTYFGFKKIDLRDDDTFAEISFEKHLFFLEKRDHIIPPTPVANTRVIVPDVDRYWKLAQELKARIFIPISDKYYGLRDFTVIDPDGYGVRFASPKESGHTHSKS